MVREYLMIWINEIIVAGFCQLNGLKYHWPNESDYWQALLCWVLALVVSLIGIIASLRSEPKHRGDMPPIKLVPDL